jgi:hypothetical protein
VIDESRSTGKSSASFGDKKAESHIQKKDMKYPLERKRSRSWNLPPKGKKTPVLPISKNPIKKLATTGPITKQKMNSSLKKTGTLKSPMLRKQTTIMPAKKKPKLVKNDDLPYQIVETLTEIKSQGENDDNEYD